jgi:hypothetical protein
MNTTSLNVGPENYRGVPPKAEPPAGWQPDPDFAAWRVTPKNPERDTKPQ